MITVSGNITLSQYYTIFVIIIVITVAIKFKGMVEQALYYNFTNILCPADMNLKYKFEAFSCNTNNS